MAGVWSWYNDVNADRSDCGGFPLDQVEVDGRRPGHDAAGVAQRLTYLVLVFRLRNHDECGRRFIYM